MKFVLIDRMFQLIKYAITKAALGAKAKCSKCKGPLEESGESKLYLIDAFIDDEHPETIAFYQNAQRIMDEGDIPSGRRSCYMQLCVCQNCRSRFVEVIDFLKVRDSEILKGGKEFSYEEMGEFYENT